MERPITTLFMLMSVDGKISTGATDALDVDKDFPKIAGVQEGLHHVVIDNNHLTEHGVRYLCTLSKDYHTNRRHVKRVVSSREAV